MPSLLKARLQEDLKTVMRAQDKVRLGAMRLMMAAIKQKEVDERIELDDEAIIVLFDKLAKQRLDSIQQFQAAGRTDLADKEVFELDLLRQYMPAPLPAAEVARLVDEQITAVGAVSMKDMGAVMAALKPLLQGRTDMAAVSKLIKDKLQ
jgi:uncharacterized protein YqeY